MSTHDQALGGGGREVGSWITKVVVKGDVVRVFGETKFANENFYNNQPKLACLTRERVIGFAVFFIFNYVGLQRHACTFFNAIHFSFVVHYFVIREMGHMSMILSFG